MTNTVREKHIDDILRKLILSTGGLDLSVKHTPGGYTLYVMNGTSVLDTVGDNYRHLDIKVAGSEL